MKKIKKYLNGNNLLTLCFLGIIFLMAVKTVPKKLGTFVKAPMIDLISNNDKSQLKVKTYEEDYNASLPYRYNFINVHGGFAQLIGKREVNGAFAMGDGYIRRPDTMELLRDQTNVDSIIKLKEKYDFLFVQPVIDVENNDVSTHYFPNGQPYDIYSVVMNKLARMRENDIDVLDLNEMADKEQLNKRDMFYKADHHWTVETSFWAYGKIIEKLNENYGCNIDSSYIDINNFSSKVYNKQFLGSVGRRTGYYFTDLMDFTVLYPKFDTDMTLDVPTNDIHRVGTFEETMITDRWLNPELVFTNDTFGTYIGGNFDYVHITNKKAPEDKTVVIIQNSFMLPIDAFISTCFKDVHILYFEQSGIEKRLAEINPDIIIANVYK